MCVLDVHVNLNTGGLSSLITSGPRYGRLYAHSDTAIITDAVFRVQKGGHQRAVKQHVRNVHAFVRGETRLDEAIEPYLTDLHIHLSELVHIRYNPFLRDVFFRDDTEQAVTSAKLVLLNKHYMLALHPKPDIDGCHDRTSGD